MLQSSLYCYTLYAISMSKSGEKKVILRFIKDRGHSFIESNIIMA